MNYFIGIDVSKSSFNYAVKEQNCKTVEKGKLSMDMEGFDKLRSIVDKYEDSIVACESTGSYHINLLSFLLAFKKEVSLINPSLIKRFISSVSLRKTKTDEIDADIIAEFMCKNRDNIRYLTLSDVDTTATVARLRESIAKQIAKTKTNIKQHVNITFPELERSCNIFTFSMLNFLKRCPSACCAKKTSIVKIHSYLKHNRGRDVNIAPKEIKLYCSPHVKTKISLLLDSPQAIFLALSLLHSLKYSVGDL